MHVILVSTNARKYSLEKQIVRATIPKGEQILTLKTIQAALENRGIKPRLFPESPLKIEVEPGTLRPTAESADNIKKAFAGVVGDSQIVFGLSVTTENYWLYEVLSQIIRAEYPGATIISGGPHFKREELFVNGKKIHDPIEIALGNNLSDGIVVGGCSPFVSYLGGRSFPDVRDPGIFWLENGKVAGHGWGQFPRLDKVPYSRTDSGLSILFRNACQNRCNFCSIVWSKTNYSEMAIQRTIDELASAPEQYIHIDDPNVFEPSQFDFYQRTLRAINIPRKGISLDPSLLVVDHPFYRGISNGNLAKEFGVYSYFFGRDSVTAEDAGGIGSKLRGKVKTRAQLDREGEALQKFIEAGIRNQWVGPGSQKLPFWVRVSYILSPFDTMESIIKKTGEMDRFTWGREGGHIDVQPQYQLLVPFPGTRVRRENIQHIKEPENFAGHMLNRNVWSESLGPQVAFLDEFLSEEAYYQNGIGENDPRYDDFIDDLLEKYM